ncbi:hypothetical protein [Leptospira brenneri]|uniref:Lactonase n=1 Tax=Leptospira brenneri TaxID=2023182 RepID=A0A2M9Y794_9LEPT|nr:hypothetical protein CH361_03005 [Leptospira brenneri]TGK95720.1 hypothetical protein EHQ30_03535 [Leptospira brenneri]
MHVDISAGQGTNSGFYPSAVIDHVSRKLLVVTRHSANKEKPSLYRCNLDGTNCTFTDISAGQLANTPALSLFSVVIDHVNGKLLAVTSNGANNEKPSLFRCNLDGTSCSHTDISAGQGTNSGLGPNALIDRINGKLLVVTSNGANSSKPGLFRCNLDGTGCSHTDISVGQGNLSGSNPSALIDHINGKLLVISRNAANQSKLSLFRCNLDGTSCSHTDISAGQGEVSDLRMILDPINGKFIVTSRNSSNNGKPSLFIW